MKLLEPASKNKPMHFKTTAGGLLYYNVTPERVQIAVRWVLLAIVLGCWLRKTGPPCSTSERAFLFILEPRRLETLWGCYLWVEGGVRGEVRVFVFFPLPTQIVRKLRVHKEQLSGAVGVSCNSCKSLINAKERGSEAGCWLKDPSSAARAANATPQCTRVGVGAARQSSKQDQRLCLADYFWSLHRSRKPAVVEVEATVHHWHGQVPLAHQWFLLQRSWSIYPLHCCGCCLVSVCPVLNLAHT